jgi:hypothetical protein
MFTPTKKNPGFHRMGTAQSPNEFWMDWFISWLDRERSEPCCDPWRMAGRSLSFFAKAFVGCDLRLGSVDEVARLQLAPSLGPSLQLAHFQLRISGMSSPCSSM